MESSPEENKQNVSGPAVVKVEFNLDRLYMMNNAIFDIFEAVGATDVEGLMVLKLMEKSFPCKALAEQVSKFVDEVYARAQAYRKKVESKCPV